MISTVSTPWVARLLNASVWTSATIRFRFDTPRKKRVRSIRPIQVLEGDGSGEIYRPDQKTDAPCYNATGRGDMTVDGTRWWWRLDALGPYRQDRLKFSLFDKQVKMRLSGGMFHANWSDLRAYTEEITTPEGPRWRFTMEIKAEMAAFIREHVKRRQV